MMPLHPFTGGPTCLFLLSSFLSFFLFIFFFIKQHVLSDCLDPRGLRRYDGKDAILFCSCVVFVPFSSTRISHFSVRLSWTMSFPLNLTHSYESDTRKTTASITVICFRLNIFCLQLSLSFC